MAAEGESFKEVSEKVTKQAEIVYGIVEDDFNEGSRQISVASKMEMFTAIYNVCPLTNDTTRWNEIGTLFINLLQQYIDVITAGCETKKHDPRALLEHVWKKYGHYNVYLKVLKQFFLYIGRWTETVKVLSELLQAACAGGGDGLKLTAGDQLITCGIEVLARSKFAKFLVEAVTPATLRIVEERRTQHNNKTLAPPAKSSETSETSKALISSSDEDFNKLANTVKLYRDLRGKIFEELQKELVQQCSKFYEQQSLGWLEAFGCYDFFRKSQLARQYEHEICTMCLPDTSTALLLFKFDIKATRDHQEQVLAKATGIKQLLQAYSEGYDPKFIAADVVKQEDGVVAPLHVIFSMLQHVDPEDRARRNEQTADLDGAKHGLVPLQNALSEFIPLELSIQCDHLEQPKDGTSKPRPLEYVRQVIYLKEKWDFLVVAALGDDRRFHKMVQTCFEKYINKEKARMAEFLSLYLHSIMKKSVKGNEDYDSVMSQCMSILTLTRDKDLFFEHYKRHFAMRLLGDRNSLNQDSERIFLTMLKERVGVHEAHHLEKMFKDIEISTDLLHEFKEKMKTEPWPPGPPLIDLAETVVVTVGHWPKGYTAQGAQPRELIPTCEAFKKFYIDKHNGRRLNWDMSKGRAEVSFKSAKIEVSTYQMCILLAMNEAQQMTMPQLRETLGLDDKLLKRHVFALSKSTAKNGKKMWPELLRLDKETEMLTVNTSFKSLVKKCSFVPEGAGPQDAQDQSKTDGFVQEQRKFEMRAALVRVMKSKKKCNIQNLISEATSILLTRFSPEPRPIKMQVERLIEQEYFKRDDDDRQVLHYLA